MTTGMRLTPMRDSTEAACSWAVHPYDGGVDLFAENTRVRDQLAGRHAEWLPSPPPGT